MVKALLIMYVSSLVRLSTHFAYSTFIGLHSYATVSLSRYVRKLTTSFIAPSQLSGPSQQWTIGPTYYAALVMAEVLGSSNVSQVLDLGANNNSIYTPAYGIYEDGNATRVALFNYITDPTGASDYTANITVTSVVSKSADTTRTSVSVK